MTKRLWVIRGIPGTGKSVVATILGKGLGDEGHVVFDINELLYSDASLPHQDRGLNVAAVKEVYDSILDQVAYAMVEDKPNIIVLGSFLKTRHIDPYFSLARNYDYTIQVMTLHVFQSDNRGLDIGQLTRLRSAMETPKTILTPAAKGEEVAGRC